MKNFFSAIYDRISGIFNHLLSDSTKLSLKRTTAAIFVGTVVIMIHKVLTSIVPAENVALFEHCYDGMLIMIAILTGVATVKDIITLRTGKLPTENKLPEPQAPETPTT